MEVRLSDAEKIFLIHGAEEGCRNDGRGCEDYRPVILERGVLSTTNGSARVRIDETDLLVGVKCELQTVDDSSLVPNSLRFSVDCSANASPQFEGKGGESFAEDIVSALEASYDNLHVLTDVNKLIISRNHIWVVYIDIIILQCGGSTIDAASIGVVAALSDTAVCELVTRPTDAHKVSVELPDSGNSWKFNVSRAPLIVSVSKIGSANVVNCTLNEEVCARSSLWVAVSLNETDNDDDNCIVPLIRQTGGGSLERTSVEEMIDVAVRTARRLHFAMKGRFREEDNQQRLPGMTFLD